VNAGRVYTLARSGQVHCLDAAKGTLVWARNITTDFGGKRPGWDLSMSPLVDGNRVILMPGGKDAAVVALDAKTGKTLWAGAGSDAPGYSTPQVATINGKRQYVVFTAASVMGLEPDKGSVLWSFPWPIKNGVNAAMPIVMGNKVFITSNYGMGCALAEVTPDGAKEVYQSKEFQSRFSTPILTGGYLYCTGETKSLVCLEPGTGTIKWQQPGFEWGGLAAVDGVLIVADGKGGDIVMVKPNPEAYEELGRFRPLGGRTWTAPIIADGKLLVRNHTTLACYDLK
jgi:outer membrane protein assembly factor BamB